VCSGRRSTTTTPTTTPRLSTTFVSSYSKVIERIAVEQDQVGEIAGTRSRMVG